MVGFALIVAALTSGYLMWPAAHAPLWAMIGVAGVVAILVGVRVNRPDCRWPWWVLAAALLLFATGDTFYNVTEAYFSASNPFPSPADAFYLMTYPLFTVGLLGLVHNRMAGRDVPGMLDALIITAGLALPVWVFLVQPLTQADGLTWEQRAISIAYPLGDVLVLALLVRLLTLGSAPSRNRSLHLLVLGTLTLLCFDIAYGILQLSGTWQAGTVLDSGWVFFYTAWGMAALHPSMAELTTREHRQESLVPPTGRLFLLSGTVLIAPGILLYEGLRGRAEDASVIAAFSGILILLVILRLTGMIVAHRKAVAREVALRNAAASLLAAVSAQEITRCCDRTVDALFGSRPVEHASMLLSADDAQDTQADTRPGTPPVGRLRDTRTGQVPPGQPTELFTRRSRLMPISRLGPGISAALGRLSTVLVCPTVGSDRPDRPDSADVPGILLTAGPVKRLGEMRSSLEILASHAGLALGRVALRKEIIRQESEAYFRTLVRNASDVILIVASDNTVRYASPSARSVFGEVKLLGTTLHELMHECDRARAARLLAMVRNGKQGEAQDHWHIPNGNGTLEVEVSCRDLRQDHTVQGLVVTLRDVTEQRQLEHELTQRAFHDPLTGLPNRMLLLERIERALLRGRRESTLTCVLFIDLDDFKIVNDNMGHSAGDQLLNAVGVRLTETVRRTDTAARLGGDEFAVLMEGAKEPIDAELLAAQIVQSLNRPFRLPDGSVGISASVGVATAMDSADSEELLSHSDLALRAAKAGGKRQWRRFQTRLRVRMIEQHDLRASLDSAIVQKDFALRYQPVVDLRGGHIVGFEALARWPHARRGLVPPQQFIALAEETGHIMPLGTWVLGKATGDIAALQQAAGRDPPYVSVNVSARQFRDPDFLDEVCGVLTTPGLSPGSLQLELTETVMLRWDGQVESVMQSLKDLGVRIALDDFGTGFSSLRYLRELPIDVLKIDKSFIDEITTDSQQVALVEGIVHIADTLGLQVIAEGIEDAGQRDLLAHMGCRYGQGFLYARPMTARQSASLLQRPRRSWRTEASGPHRGTARRGSVGPVEDPSAGEGSSTMPDITTSIMKARRDQRLSDLEHLRRTSPMSDAVLDEVQGRHIRCGDRWLIDFASCNYLGFDCDPEIIGAIEPAVRRWGTHPSWSRLLGSPRIYPEIEERLAALLEAPDTLLLPTATLIHASVIPVLAGSGHVFVEATAHRTVYDGCVAARGQGATLQRFRGDRPDQLDAQLGAVPPGSTRLVCLDGVNSMSGNIPDVPRLAAICRNRGATLYLDDTHGFGIVGERRGDELCPYGARGNSVVRHTGETYDDIVLVGGFSKAYSSLLAFLALPTPLKDLLKIAAGPYLYSGPSPTASLATTLAGLQVNERRGDAIRADVYRKTAKVLDHVHGLGMATPNTDGLPIVEIVLSDASDLDAVADFLWDSGIYVTLAAYPLVPRARVGFRVQITALNSDDDIDRLNTALTALCERFAVLRPGS
ncbi:aminotransferase class I/II-fold pyridoxal phosphate-dependent enzyme [Streptomyces globisporus]